MFIRHTVEAHFRIQQRKKLAAAKALSDLKNPKTVEKMGLEEFLKVLITSDETARFALNCDYVQSKLNKTTSRFVQTFEKSCAARCILQLLFDVGKIAEKDVTSTKELEIYSKIWSAPGKEADPNKLLAYLKDQGFEVTIVEDHETTHSKLKDAPTSIKHAYHALHEAKQPKLTFLNFDKRRSNPISAENKIFLIITTNSEGLHITYGKQQQQSWFHSFFIRDFGNDSSSRNLTSINDLLISYSEFSGVALMVSEKASSSDKQLERKTL